MTTNQRVGPGRIAAVAALVLLPALLSACNIVGPLAYFAMGPEAVPAVHGLDPAKTTVVFVDDRSNRIPTRATREIIGKTAEEDLLGNGAVKDMVKSSRVHTVVAAERYGRPTGIAEVGAAVQAQVVIYAYVDRFVLTEDNQSVAPAARLRVKVIDVASTERLFPPPDSEEEYYDLNVRVPVQSSQLPTTAAARQQVEQELARWCGRALARMFRETKDLSDPTRLDR